MYRHKELVLTACVFSQCFFLQIDCLRLLQYLGRLVILGEIATAAGYCSLAANFQIQHTFLSQYNLRRSALNLWGVNHHSLSVMDTTSQVFSYSQMLPNLFILLNSV